MAEAATADREQTLVEWLRPFMEALGHRVRQRWAPVYVRGLLGPGERKSVQPMAARVAPADCDQLHHLISSPACQTALLAALLAREADRLVGGSDAALIIDDTALPKKGKHSARVARQYASVLGKTANCQVMVSLTLARGEVPVPGALRLYLPKAWCQDRRRCDKAGVLADCRAFRSKSAIALEEFDRLRAAGFASAVPWPTAAMAAAPPSGAVSPPAPRSGRWAYLDSPYAQLFCGEVYFQPALPLDRSLMTRWRQADRAGAAGGAAGRELGRGTSTASPSTPRSSPRR
jgi:hypothetical protein